MNEIRMSPYIKQPKKSLKNRNMSLDMLLMTMFNFKYAGKANIYIHTRFNKFELVVQGVHIVEDIFLFTPNYVKRYKFDSLYQAIIAFNQSVQLITSSMDWFNPEVFKGTDLYHEIFFKE